MNASFIIDPPLARNYASYLLQFEKGEGVYLQDKNNNRYLDFGAGIAVNALGYGRKDLAKVAYDQMKKLIHVSNLYTTAPTVELACRLTEIGTAKNKQPFQAVQFGNSGAEANEAALKYARLYANYHKGENSYTVVSFTNGFHGRTMGSLSCTPKPKYQEPFKPLLPGIRTLPFNNPSKVEKEINTQVAGIFVEVVQGEGGLTTMTTEFAEALNKIKNNYDCILIADEVQTGLGRTGTFYASEQVGLQPDIITLSKPLAGGLPLSATLIPEKINRLLHPGVHGTTFGGGPVTTAVALKVLSILANKKFLHETKDKGEYFYKKLCALQREFPFVKEVRGMGMLRGIVLDINNKKEDPIKDVMDRCRENGLLILRSGTNLLRFAPPLVISKQEIDKGIDILQAVLKSIQKEHHNDE